MEIVRESLEKNEINEIEIISTQAIPNQFKMRNKECTNRGRVTKKVYVEVNDIYVVTYYLLKNI